jgi:MerR family transcriptional regulator, light-induced transcriptional regulator
MASLAHSDAQAGTLSQTALGRVLSSEAPDPASFHAAPRMEHEVSLEHDKSLSKLIENEIIPRLMMAHAGDARCHSAAEIEVGEVAALAELVLEVEADALLAGIEDILARGVSVDTVMVDLLAPTARMLGEYWESDRCDFIDVTMGLWRLQEVVRDIAARAPSERLIAAGGHRALFAAMPGDQHSFGTVVLDELFRREGWMTERMNGAETSDLLKAVRREWFDLIGLTVSCDCHSENVGSIIVALRNVSKNSRVCIMVGGPVFCENPDLAAKIGADGTAADAKLALKVALDLVRKREREALAVS